MLQLQPFATSTTYQEHHQMDKECVEKGDSPRHLV